MSINLPHVAGFLAAPAIGSLAVRAGMALHKSDNLKSTFAQATALYGGLGILSMLARHHASPANRDVFTGAMWGFATGAGILGFAAITGPQYLFGEPTPTASGDDSGPDLTSLSLWLAAQMPKSPK